MCASWQLACQDGMSAADMCLTCRRGEKKPLNTINNAKVSTLHSNMACLAACM